MPLLALVQPGPWAARLLLAAAALATMTGPMIVLRRHAGADRTATPAEQESRLQALAQKYFNRASTFPATAAALLVVLALLTL